MRQKRIAVWVAAILLLFAPAGCSAFPSSGEPQKFALETPLREPIKQFGSGPQAGSDPSRLISDFLRASSAGSFDDYATARQYLLPETRLSWQPGEQVLIFPTEATPKPELVETSADSAKVTLQVTTKGSLDEMGILEELPESGTTSVSFDLMRDDEGEWRIAALENGVVLSQSAFSTGWQQENLYFVSTDQSALVPDPRWFPRNRIATYLVQGLIDGPSAQINDAVVDGLMAGLMLPTSGVEVRDRVARVDLQGQTSLTQEDRLSLQWSVKETVLQAANVQNVDVRVNLVALDSPGVPSGPNYYLDRVTAVNDDHILVGSIASSDVAVAGDKAGRNPRFPRIGPLEKSPIAWLETEEGLLRILYPGAAEVRTEEIGAATLPSIDRLGNIWVVAGSDLVVVKPDSPPVSVDAGISGDTVLRKVTISPDGARIALLTNGSRGGTLWVGAVGLNPEDGSFQITALELEDRAGSGVLDISWSGETNLLALIEGTSGGDPVVKAVPIGGWSYSISAPEGVTRVTAGSGKTALLLQDEQQEAYQRSGAAWLDLGNQLQDLSFAG